MKSSTCSRIWSTVVRSPQCFKIGMMTSSFVIRSSRQIWFSPTRASRPAAALANKPSLWTHISTTGDVMVTPEQLPHQTFLPNGCMYMLIWKKSPRTWVDLDAKDCMMHALAKQEGCDRGGTLVALAVQPINSQHSTSKAQEWTEWNNILACGFLCAHKADTGRGHVAKPSVGQTQWEPKWLFS